jgi:hypothetical protein
MSSKVRDVTMLGLLTMVLGFAKVPHSGQVAPADMTGEWTIQAQREGRVRLQLRRSEKGKDRASVSIHVGLPQFQSLTEEQVFSNAATVNFRLVREAGTFTFSGSFHKGAGTGQWTFKAEQTFVSLLRKHGYQQPTSEELYALAIGDVRGSYIADLERESYSNLPISQLVSLYTNGVGVDYIAGLRSAGYTAISPNELVALRSNGVTMNDARVLQGLVSGDLPAQQLIALKSNDVSVPYITSLGDVGYKGLTAAQLLALRTNGVTRDFIERLKRRGQTNLTVERLLSLRINAGPLN